MDILFLPLTVSAYADRKKALLETWGRRLHSEKDIYWLDKENGFEQIPFDYIEFITNELTNEEIWRRDWFVFCDDDTYIYPQTLYYALHRYRDDPRSLCVGQIITFNRDPGGQKLRGGDPALLMLPFRYPGGGAGFALNRHAMLALRTYLRSDQDPPVGRNGDVSMGLWCRAAGVHLLDQPGMNGATPWELGHTSDEIKRNISYHRLGSEQFYELEKYDLPVDGEPPL